jgi:hypothetical protein
MGESKRRKESIGDEYGKEDASLPGCQSRKPKAKIL